MSFMHDIFEITKKLFINTDRILRMLEIEYHDLRGYHDICIT